MTHGEFKTIENHMLSLMRDSAHDKHHVYRVLYSAVDIAKCENGVDTDVLLAACLLHDIGRQREFENPNLCHAQEGGNMAFDFLLTLSWGRQKALHVKDCISSHRYRDDNPPETIEAKILFDADKLDASGAMGIARTLLYHGQVSTALYLLGDDGEIPTESTDAATSSFFQEYNYKLKNLYGSFHTERAEQIAAKRQQTAETFYNGLFDEIAQNYRTGTDVLNSLLNK